MQAQPGPFRQVYFREMQESPQAFPLEQNLQQTLTVGTGTGASVGLAVETDVGMAVGTSVGAGHGVAVGAAVGVGSGVAVGGAVSVGSGSGVGAMVGGPPDVQATTRARVRDRRGGISLVKGDNGHPLAARIQHTATDAVNLILHGPQGGMRDMPVSGP